MIIKGLNLKNFGKFTEERFVFSDGINVIYGPNESGKTTIYQAIMALLFGLDKQRGRAAKNDTYTTYQPWENKTWYEGSLRFEVDGKAFCLERNFYHNEKAVRLFCETDGEELSVEDGDLEMLLGDIGGELYLNTAAVGQLRMKPQEIIYSYLKNYIAGVHEAGKNATDVVAALELLQNRKKKLEQKKKKAAAEITEQLARLDVKLDLLGKEIEAGSVQMDVLWKQAEELKKSPVQTKKGLFARMIAWIRGLFGRKRRMAQEREKEDALIKIEEKIAFLKELLGEKESQQEEILLEKEAFYEALHEQSKDEEGKAIELAMARIQELSVISKEEVMQDLLQKTSAVLVELTKGKYQKLLLEEGEEPLVWDGHRTIRLFQLSTGCVDQVYLALRIGLQDLFFKEETLPLLFDDAFVYFDDKRLERLLHYLGDLNRQVLLFSCQKRELRLLEKQGISYRKILL